MLFLTTPSTCVSSSAQTCFVYRTNQRRQWLKRGCVEPLWLGPSGSPLGWSRRLMIRLQRLAAWNKHPFDEAVFAWRFVGKGVKIQQDIGECFPSLCVSWGWGWPFMLNTLSLSCALFNLNLLNWALQRSDESVRTCSLSLFSLAIPFLSSPPFNTFRSFPSCTH